MKKISINGKAFTLAEMMMAMLIISIIIAASMPVITKRSKAPSQDQISNIPPGVIMAFAGDTIPPGWLLCDGQSTAAHPALLAVVGPNVPDLRGIFIRGAGTSSKLTNANGTAFSGTFGIYQNDRLQGHGHDVYLGTSGATTGGATRSRVAAGATDDGPALMNYGARALNTYSYGTPRTAYETNPANLSLNYIIKY